MVGTARAINATFRSTSALNCLCQRDPRGTCQLLTDRWLWTICALPWEHSSLSAYFPLLGFDLGCSTHVGLVQAQLSTELTKGEGMFVCVRCIDGPLDLR